VRRLNQWDYKQTVTYNLRDGGTAVSIFAETQRARVRYTRGMLEHTMLFVPSPARIIELGCSAGDISGPYAKENIVWGCDIVPAAVEQTRLRYPAMSVENAPIEEIAPTECDILILCEILEHVIDPVALVQKWMPLAKFTIISHPLTGENAGNQEPGHLWAYDMDDFLGWFKYANYEMNEYITFINGMATVLGIGERR